jgi:hypothetical protein
LTKAIKENIAKQAVKELFVPSLLEAWKDVEAQFSSLVKDIFSDFDWEHVEAYRDYMNWHNEIKLSNLPREWQIYWDDFRRMYSLPSVSSIELSFEYPSPDAYLDELDAKYQQRAEDILRPYMIKYLTAKTFYKEVNQTLLGITTSKQLEEMVPELGKYVPKTETGTITALVPIEQISRIRRVLQKEAV